MRKTLLILLLLFPLLGCFGQKKVHPDFNISQDQLKELISLLPEDVQQAILEKPDTFFEKLSLILSGPEEFMWLVDKEQSLASTYAPGDLADIVFYQISGTREGLLLRKVIISPLLSMFQSASQAGHHLVVGSAYRSYQNQQAVYQHWVDLLGQEQADRESARPGHSQHQLGTTLDFSPIEANFADLPEGKWLLENAWEFGFSLSYPQGLEGQTGYIYEPWHYRYMGLGAAFIIKHFFQGNQQSFLEFYQLSSDFFKAAWVKS